VKILVFSKKMIFMLTINNYGKNDRKCSTAFNNWSGVEEMFMLIGIPSLLMQIPAGFEWVLIIIVVVVLFFGVKKIPEFARSFGRAKTEYEKAKIEARRELQKVKNDTLPTSDSVAPAEDREKLESIADTLGIDYTRKSTEELRTSIELELEKGKRQKEI
jgi:sec-independent protein translocase protein TatA